MIWSQILLFAPLHVMRDCVVCILKRYLEIWSRYQYCEGFNSINSSTLPWMGIYNYAYSYLFWRKCTKSITSLHGMNIFACFFLSKTNTQYLRMSATYICGIIIFLKLWFLFWMNIVLKNYEFEIYSKWIRKRDILA